VVCHTSTWDDSRPAVCAGLSLILGLAINQLILLAVHRVRPYDAGVTHLLIDRSADWSFPSDHATASISVACAFLFKQLPKRTLLMLAIASIVCWSRVHVGMHYVSDNLGGAVTGLIAAIVIQFVYREGNPIDRFVTRML
jgi:undecaprenyl-diphosphatase